VETHRRRHTRGFTLIELLVVVLLIALTAGLVAVNFQPDGGRLVEREALRAGALLNQMRDEAVLAARPMALEVSDEGNGYRFMRFDREWQPLADADVFRPRQLPADVKVALVEPVATRGEAPRVVATATGDMSSFELVFSNPSAQASVVLGAEGTIEVNPEDK